MKIKLRLLIYKQVERYRIDYKHAVEGKLFRASTETIFICLHFYLAIPITSYLKSQQFELNMYIVTLANFQARPLMGMPDSDTSVRYKIRYRHITKVTDIIALPC